MKQRVLYISLFVLSSFLSVFGQVWTHIFDDYTAPNHAYRILPMPDSTMLVLINEEAGRDTFQMRLIRITEEGEVIIPIRPPMGFTTNCLKEHKAMIFIGKSWIKPEKG